mmetsp:Transcript_11958/g.25244  ORF Transcript_11958/g.25244 Transcript_11958/m.25244 type:complete len:93 (+) Transcript_11958:1171-1449(+)
MTRPLTNSHLSGWQQTQARSARCHDDIEISRYNINVFRWTLFSLIDGNLISSWFRLDLFTLWLSKNWKNDDIWAGGIMVNNDKMNLACPRQD